MNASQQSSLGPIRLAPGVTRRHVLCYLFAAFISIGLFTYFTALTPYILEVNLGLPKSEHGRVSGDLQFWQEVVLLLTIGLWGAMSDRFSYQATARSTCPSQEPNAVVNRRLGTSAAG